MTDGFDVVLNCTNCCSSFAFDSFNFLIASCLFLNLSLLNKASPVVLLVVLTGMTSFASSVLSSSFDSSFDLNLESNRVLLFLDFLLLGGGRILRLRVDLRVVLKGGMVVWL